MTQAGPPAWTRWLAASLGGLAALQVAIAAVLLVILGWSLRDALEGFVLTNSVMGVAFAVCGTIVAWHRPSNAIGWLFIACGLGHATTAFGALLLDALYIADTPLGAQRLVATVTVYAWPWSIALFLPLALLLFPDGQPLSPRWRPVTVAVIATAPLFVLYMGAGPEPWAERVLPYLRLPGYDSLEPLWMLAEVRQVGVLALAIVVLGLRYRRAAEAQRRQLLWLVLATIAMLAFTLPWGFIAGTPVVVLFAIPLIPVAVTIAIVRHQLLDIRLVVSRALAWVALSVAAVLTYIGVVAVLDTFVAAQFGRSAVATVLVALIVAPLLPRLQRAVDRAMYGDRGDPARVASSVGKQLVACTASDLSGVVIAVRDALRVPSAAVLADGKTLVAVGEQPERSGSVGLEYGGAPIGELVVGLRPGERELSAADGGVLRLVAAPLAVAVYATRLSDELQASRQRIVTAGEEERRRLRRDLHDGLGPTLTGIALTADAAANLVTDDATRASELLAAMRADARNAIADVRRLVEDLRPPALDELGLIGALRQRVEQVQLRADGEAIRARLDAPARAPALPAAVEVAGYRIAIEALHNIVRHSRAATATVRVSVADALVLEVTDDGAPNGAWTPGVGLRGMRERAVELDGRFEAGPTPSGGRVIVSLPLEQA